DVVDFLLDYGIDVDAEGPRGLTALHYAAYQGNIVVVKKLLELGAPIYLQDHERKPPLDYAQTLRHHEVVNCLGGTFRKYTFPFIKRLEPPK
ncbi:ankyrin, partial [Melanomma pulvis-pyrius CBS 109.77]